jgi:hypothetical protein
MGRGSVAASSAAGLAAALGGGDDGPLLSIDRNKEERARKVRTHTSVYDMALPNRQWLVPGRKKTYSTDGQMLPTCSVTYLICPCTPGGMLREQQVC